MVNKRTKNEQAVHDANNRLASIMMSAELLAQEIAGPLTAKQKKYAQGILSESKKLQTLLGKITG